MYCCRHFSLPFCLTLAWSPTRPLKRAHHRPTPTPPRRKPPYTPHLRRSHSHVASPGQIPFHPLREFPRFLNFPVRQLVQVWDRMTLPISLSPWTSCTSCLTSCPLDPSSRSCVWLAALFWKAYWAVCPSCTTSLASRTSWCLCSVTVECIPTAQTTLSSLSLWREVC